jgi:hypothetical protein
VDQRAVLLRQSQKATDAKESDQLYYLKNSVWKELLLTRFQQVKVNARLGLRKDPKIWLSPRQLAESELETKHRPAQHDTDK